MTKDSDDIKTRLDLLNRMALEDEPERAICYPLLSQDADTIPVLAEFEREAAKEISTQNLQIWSFDIDLTLTIPDDAEEYIGPIPVDELIRLQKQPDTIVGTCSDRDPSNQRKAMRSLQFEPDFCIPKEMLQHATRLFPDSRRIHVGDDPARDKAMADKSGWEHRWPDWSSSADRGPTRPPRKR